MKKRKLTEAEQKDYDKLHFEDWKHPVGYFDPNILNAYPIGIEEMVLFYCIINRWRHTVLQPFGKVRADLIRNDLLYIAIDYLEVVRLTRRFDGREKHKFRHFVKADVKKYFERLENNNLIIADRSNPRKYYYRPNLKNTDMEIYFNDLIDLRRREKEHINVIKSLATYLSSTTTSKTNPNDTIERLSIKDAFKNVNI